MTGGESCSTETRTEGRGYIFFFSWGLICYHCTGWTSKSCLSLIYPSMKTAGTRLKITTAAKSLQLCLTLCNPIDCSPPGSPRPWDSPGKNTGVGCHCLLQNNFICRVKFSSSQAKKGETETTETRFNNILYFY